MTSVRLGKGWLAIGCRRRLSNLLTFTWNFQLNMHPRQILITDPQKKRVAFI